MADIYYTDVPPVTDSPPYRVPYTPATPRRLRNWRLALLATLLALALPVACYLLGWASLAMAGIGAGIMLLELVVWLLLAWRFDRL